MNSRMMISIVLGSSTCSLRVSTLGRMSSTSVITQKKTLSKSRRIAARTSEKITSARRIR